MRHENTKAGEKLTLLGTAEQRAILLETKVDVDEVSARKQLHDHAGCDDGCDSELHKRSAVRGKDYAHPVQRV